MDKTSNPNSAAVSVSVVLREPVSSPEGGKLPDWEATVTIMLGASSSEL